MTTSDLLDARTRRSATVVLLVVAGSICLGFSAGAAVQTLIFQLSSSGAGDASGTVVAVFFLRLFVNFATVAVFLVIAMVFRLPTARGQRRVWAVVAGAVAGGVFRAWAQWLLGIQLDRSWEDAGTEAFAGSLVGALSLLLGLLAADLLVRLRHEERRAALQELRVTEALDALQVEELRVRREVVDGLHGGVQQRLVIVDRLLAEVERAVEDGATGADAAAMVSAVRTELDEVRGVDLRELGVLLYPEGLELGLAPATRIMIRRVPATISVELQIDQQIVDGDADSLADPQSRLILLRVIEEAISNALRHGRASRLRIALRAADGVLSAEIDDDGVGIPKDAVLRGLAGLRARLEAFGGLLVFEASERLGGAHVTARLPVDRGRDSSSALAPLGQAPQ